jgi:tetratricopeptide (TPR) repeat protein
MIAAQTKYDAGDRLAALRLWEKALRSDPDQDERLAALFNSTAVYASTGDLELARMSLREAVQLGLDYNATCQGNGDPRCVEMRASQQMLIQLRKFNEAVLKAMASKTATPSPPPGMRSSMKKNTSDSYIRRSSSSNSKKLRDNADDLTNILETDMEGLDTSILGVVKRVTLVLLALSVLGVGLFFYGLKYLTPPE